MGVYVAMVNLRKSAENKLPVSAGGLTPDIASPVNPLFRKRERGLKQILNAKQKMLNNTI
jgi:hypothetical protein